MANKFTKQVPDKEFDAANWPAGNYVRFIRLPDDNGNLITMLQIHLIDAEGRELYENYPLTDVFPSSASVIHDKLKDAARYLLQNKGYTEV